ncbi:5-formyltetrahydrofolate cyclo-ligase [Vibrio sp. S9_S30]|uniref:5-formyltetrahydrofolate cyclo-ligase n=1 Tax=Vibrio sp. S9_S30 TaxID=2720226 RepID=UPI001681BCEB|nr:5-formyltetrahydrofolate cyclo-ligase [Vibrio sp. S9_S30]MBD1555326.1 5-formyltetrahydrofolate cyclo-ligase [Vibrio sp. S9_S30]
MTSFTPSKASSQQRQAIRQNIRCKRRHLSNREQIEAAQGLLSQLQKHTAANEANTVALYLAVDGELNLTPVIEWYWNLGKRVCLPVLHPFSNGHLLFLEYTPLTDMVANQYKIEEPKLTLSQIVPINEIDIIYTPLVAFDEQGQRLGMGGGYYDRTLASWESSSGHEAIGLAHDCQQVALLPVEAWDIPLKTIVTPSKTWQWNAKPR